MTVFAAASLTEVFQAMAPKMTYNFAGSDQLAFQIQQGAPADVFASANIRYPDQLFTQGLVTKPAIFTYNNVVVITPKSNPAGITSIQDITKPGVKLVMADPAVPVGSYARTVFRNLGISTAALANVVSNENDVKAVVAKVALGEADAGIVYQTDVGPGEEQGQRHPGAAGGAARGGLRDRRGREHRQGRRGGPLRDLRPLQAGRRPGSRSSASSSLRREARVRGGHGALHRGRPGLPAAPPAGHLPARAPGHAHRSAGQRRGRGRPAGHAEDQRDRQRASSW